MMLNLDRRFSPDHVLDILPESSEDRTIILEFLGEMSNLQDFNRVQVAAVEDGVFCGICIWLE